MAVIREQPYTGAHFLVLFDGQDGRGASAGFAEVVFAPFEHDREGRVDRDGREGQDGGSSDVAGGRATSGDVPRGHGLVVLRRGVTGSLDLYKWWAAAGRESSPPTRTVTIQLLADDHDTVVMTWRLLRAWPTTLSYSPLNAMSVSVVMEQVTLAFERVEME